MIGFCYYKNYFLCKNRVLMFFMKWCSLVRLRRRFVFLSVILEGFVLIFGIYYSNVVGVLVKYLVIFIFCLERGIKVFRVKKNGIDLELNFLLDWFLIKFFNFVFRILLLKFIILIFFILNVYRWCWIYLYFIVDV